MSLERRLSEALHRRDDFHPSIDLFARLSRSIEEDKRHRRRLRTAGIAITGGVAALTVFLSMTSERTGAGVIGWPRWSLQVATVAILLPVLLALAPAIRRMGAPVISDVFHLDPRTGERFSRLLDIAYYLAFGGGIILSLDLANLTELVLVTDEAFLFDTVWQIALFLGLLGATHAMNLLTLPVIGLFYSSIVRRARRRDAGIGAMPVSPAARSADRMVIAIVVTVVLVGMAALLIIIALGITGI